MMSLLALALLGTPDAIAGGEARVETLVGGRTAPQVTSQGPAQLVTKDGPAALAAVRAEVESEARRGVWVGAALESWAYLPDPELSLVRAEPRAGWTPALGALWRADLGARYALEGYPWSASLSSGRAEATAGVGPTVGPLKLGLEGSYVRRDFFGTPSWSFQMAEGGCRVSTAPSAGGLRASLRLSSQFNAGFTVDTAGDSHPATGTQARGRADVGWTGGSVDLNVGWSIIRAWEGNVEDAARPQFTPIGQYADDTDALSAGGFVQNRFDLSMAWLPRPAWTLGLDGMLRLRTTDPGQASGSLATSAHLQGRVERKLSDQLTLLGTAGLTHIELVTGSNALDLYGWTGLRWRPKRDEAEHAAPPTVPP